MYDGRMSKLKSAIVAIADLQHDPLNARKHGKRNIEAIKDSLTRFGQQKPIIVADGNIVIAGNGTMTAAAELGWAEIAVTYTNLTAEECRAFAIADNRTAEFAEWDDDALLASLEEIGGDLHRFAGFTEDEIASLQFVSTVDSEDDKPRFDPDKYEARVLKQIVLIFGLQEYEQVFDGLAAYAEKHGLSNNSEVIIHLLEKNGHAISTSKQA